MLCPNCKQEVTGKYCNFCGTPLEPDHTNDKPDENFTSKPSKSVSVKKVRQKTKVKKRKKKKGNLLSSAFSLTTGSVKSAWKLFMFCIQWVCGALMLLSTFYLARGFWASRTALGSIAKVIEERNYAQAVFLAGAVCIVAFGLIQTLWTLSRKKMPDQGKVRRIDMGRGLFGFCVMVLLILAAGYINPLIPENPVPLLGIKQIFRVVTGLGTRFFVLNVTGILFCIIRKVGTR